MVRIPFVEREKRKTTFSNVMGLSSFTLMIKADLQKNQSLKTIGRYSLQRNSNITVHKLRSHLIFFLAGSTNRHGICLLLRLSASYPLSASVPFCFNISYSVGHTPVRPIIEFLAAHVFFDRQDLLKMFLPHIASLTIVTCPTRLFSFADFSSLLTGGSSKIFQSYLLVWSTFAESISFKSILTFNVVSWQWALL